MSSRKKTLIGHDPLTWIDPKQANLLPSNPLSPKTKPPLSNIPTAASKQSEIIVLKSTTTIAHVAELRQNWQQYLNHAEIIIDASKVDHLDTAALQLLCSLIRTAQQRKINIQWRNPSTQIQQAANLLGMTITLGF